MVECLIVSASGVQAAAGPERAGRKVRAPEGRVLGNSQGVAPRGAIHGKCNRKYTAPPSAG